MIKRKQEKVCKLYPKFQYNNTCIKVKLTVNKAKNEYIDHEHVPDQIWEIMELKNSV